MASKAQRGKCLQVRVWKCSAASGPYGSRRAVKILFLAVLSVVSVLDLNKSSVAGISAVGLAQPSGIGVAVFYNARDQLLASELRCRPLLRVMFIDWPWLWTLNNKAQDSER